MFLDLVQSKLEKAAKVYKTPQFSSAATAARRRRRMKEIA
jgi:hypothetical protein